MITADVDNREGDICAEIMRMRFLQRSNILLQHVHLSSPRNFVS